MRRPVLQVLMALGVWRWGNMMPVTTLRVARAHMFVVQPLLTVVDNLY